MRIIVGRAQHAGRIGGPGVGGVDLQCLGVQRGDVLVAADMDIGVGRHVDQMAGAWRQACQPLGIGQGVGRVAGGLGGVDIVVDGGGVVGLCLQDRQRDGAGLGRGGMVAPPVGREQGFRRDQPDVGLGRVPGDGRQQGVGEVDLGLGRLLALVAVDQGLGETSLLIGLRDLERHPGHAQRRRLVGLVDVEVLGRAARQGLAPAAHGAVRIGRHRLVEGQPGVGVIEGVEQLDAIVEPFLGLGARGAHGEAARADARHEVELPGALGRGEDALGAADVADADGAGVDLRGARGQERQDHRRRCESLHASSSSAAAEFGSKVCGRPEVCDAASAVQGPRTCLSFNWRKAPTRLMAGAWRTGWAWVSGS